MKIRVINQIINQIKNVSREELTDMVLAVHPEFTRDDCAEMSSSKMVGLLISAIVGAALMPTIVTSYMNTNTTGWTTTMVTLWELAPLLIVISVVMGYVHFKKGN